MNRWDAASMALGPIAVGACLALGHGNTVATAARVPVVFALVAAMMVPALYIGSALIGIAPSAQTMAEGVMAAFRASGVAFLGLAPAVAFLVATESADQSMSFLGQGVVLIGGLLALRALYRTLFDQCLARAKAALLFSAWALVSLGIGGHLYVTRAVM